MLEQVQMTHSQQFDDFYQVHWWPMVRLAMGLTGNRAAAEDAVQDAFQALYPKWNSVTGAARLTYVRTSVVNATRREHRKRQTAVKHQPRLVSVGGFDLPEHRLELAEEREELWRALSRLSDRQREVLSLRYLADASDEEIATVTGLSTGGVRSAASRALATLRTVMSGELQ